MYFSFLKMPIINVLYIIRIGAIPAVTTGKTLRMIF